MDVKVKMGFMWLRIRLRILGCSEQDNDPSIKGGIFVCRLRAVT
jgi:hypothetical protein